ncbi:MAG: DUF3332 domain-containing protein [Bacteroidales bacterium]
MRKVKSLLLAALFLSVMVLQTGCFGSFKLTNSLYDWNMEINSDAGKEVVFLAFVIIPVYGVTLFIDAVILNTIEYWTGSSPMALAPGESESQIVEKGGNSYQITATHNQFHVEQLTGKKAGQSYDLVYNEEEGNWYITANGKTKKFASYKAGKMLKLFKPDGSAIEVDPAVASRNSIKAAVNLDMVQLDE